MARKFSLVALVVLVWTASTVSGQNCAVLQGRWAYGPTLGVGSSGDTVVFGSGAMLVVVDGSAPATAVGEIELPGVVMDVAIAGSHAYVASYRAGLQIVDLSDPTDPEIVGSVPAATGGLAKAVAASGNYAFYTDDHSNGLQVVDVSDPAHPSVVGSAPDAGWAEGIIVAGSYAYVAGMFAGLHIVDVSDPANPSLVGTYDTPGRAYGVAVAGSYAYVADENQGLRIIDVSDPTAPVEVGSWADNGICTDVEVNGQYAFLANSSGLRVVDVSDPAAPTEVELVGSPGSSVGVAVSGGRAYLADGVGGLRVIDVSSPGSSSETGSHEGRGIAEGVAVAGSHAVISEVGRILRSIDISDPSRPTEAGWIASRGIGYEVALSGSYAMVAGGGQGLWVIDISDPVNPTVVTSHATAGSAQGLAVAGDYAYVAGGSEGLSIVDVSSPANPLSSGWVDTPGYAFTVAITDDHALIADDDGGLRVIDVSDPSDPTEVASLATENLTFGIAVEGGTAYVADGWGGIAIVDISNPANPAEIGRDETNIEYALGSIVVRNGVVYAGEWNGGLKVIDASDPASPVEVGHFNAAGDVSAVALSGDRAIVTDRLAGLAVLNVADCTSAPSGPVANFTWSPTMPEIGQDVQFTDTSSGSPTSWSWDFGDGATSSEQHPTHAWATAGSKSVRLTVSDGSSSDTVTKTVTVRPAGGGAPPITSPGELVWVIPAAGRVAGSQGTHWVTDVVLHNVEPMIVPVNLYFMEADQDNSSVQGVQLNLLGEQSIQLEDVVLSVFGESSATGAILVGSDGLLLVSSRTYNDAASGTYGQYIPGFMQDRWIGGSEPSHLIQLTHNQLYRTNLGFANPNPSALEVEVDLMTADASPIGSATFTIPPYGFHQENGIIGDFGGGTADDAFAIVRATSLAQPFLSYASIVDNSSGDPIFSAPGQYGNILYVPASAHVTGANDTNWRTDLEVFNPEPVGTDITIELLRANQSNNQPDRIVQEVPPGHSLRFGDVLAETFGFTGTAALRVSSAPMGLIAASRTYNDLGTETYGQFIPAVADWVAIQDLDQARMTGLFHSTDASAGFRTNIGFVSASDGTMTIEVALFASDGTLLGSQLVELAPYEFRQVNGIFGRVTPGDVTNGYAVVTSTTADAAYFAYASVVDNRSGDPVYIPAAVMGAIPPPR